MMNLRSTSYASSGGGTIVALQLRKVAATREDQNDILTTYYWPRQEIIVISAKVDKETGVKRFMLSYLY